MGLPEFDVEIFWNTFWNMLIFLLKYLIENGFGQRHDEPFVMAIGDSTLILHYCSNETIISRFFINHNTILTNNGNTDLILDFGREIKKLKDK